MIEHFEIKTFENLINIGTKLGKNWFRGHSKIHDNLLPGIFRQKYHSSLHELFKPGNEYEQELLINFKRYAPTIISSIPKYKDFLTWLFWIQHHGIPTRLLDWSESVLIAAFFAVVEDSDCDGEIWTIYPEKLNELSGIGGLAIKGDKKVKYLSSEAFHNNPIELQKKFNLNEAPNFPIALLPPNIFKRMGAQLSVFTIHPNPESSGKKIEDVLTEKIFITRYLISKKLKPKFEKNLSRLGVNYRTLFPDLEGLARSFARDERHFGWNQPDPPDFND